MALTLLLGASPIPATETDVKEDGSSAEATPERATAPEAESRPDTSVCLDEKALLTLDVNTLEDIFSLSTGNMAKILDEPTEKVGEKKPASDEVRWKSLETGSGKTQQKKDTSEKSGDD